MIKMRKHFLITIMCLIGITFYISCDSGGSSGGGGQDTETSTIQGTVTNIVASAEKEERSSKFTKILNLLALINEAKAQGGILVTAIVDGNTVASDFTDAQGNFTLILELVSATNVLLLFDVNGSDVSIEILVEEGSIININISIDLNAPEGDEVEIVDMEDVQGPIRCENGRIDIIKNSNETLVIDGGGEACIRTAGNCEVFVDPENIILTNCEQCVDARGTSEVTILSSNGDILCEASEDGFRARGNAEVIIEALGVIDILSGDNGLKADGNSLISLDADTCIIESSEETIDTNGNATVNTSGCGEILTVSPSPSPSPEPSPSPSPSP